MLSIFWIFDLLIISFSSKYLDFLTNEFKFIKWDEDNICCLVGVEVTGWKIGDMVIFLLFVLLLQIGHGDFSSANTKVLRMVNTLAVDNEAKQTIEALQKELEKTKEKLQAVEELKKQSGTESSESMYW